MRLDPRTIVELLQRLERKHADLRPHLADAALLLSKSDFQRAIETIDNLHSAVESIIVTCTRLNECVLSVDGLGDPESAVELAIRARRVVITMQVGRLREAFQDPARTKRAHGWFQGKLRGIDDVLRFLDELVKRSSGWEHYRKGRPLPVGMKDGDRITMYRTTVRVAQQTMRELGTDPDVTHFLQRGIAATDWPEAYEGCKHIASAVAGEIDQDPDPGAAAAPRARLPSASAATP
jgi:hypothetical protein